MKRKLWLMCSYMNHSPFYTPKTVLHRKFTKGQRKKVCWPGSTSSESGTRSPAGICSQADNRGEQEPRAFTPHHTEATSANPNYFTIPLNKEKASLAISLLIGRALRVSSEHQLASMMIRDPSLKVLPLRTAQRDSKATLQAATGLSGDDTVMVETKREASPPSSS